VSDNLQLTIHKSGSGKLDIINGNLLAAGPPPPSPAGPAR
jgi:hypothetical protein